MCATVVSGVDAPPVFELRRSVTLRTDTLRLAWSCGELTAGDSYGDVTVKAMAMAMEKAPTVAV